MGSCSCLTGSGPDFFEVGLLFFLQRRIVILCYTPSIHPAKNAAFTSGGQVNKDSFLDVTRVLSEQYAGRFGTFKHDTGSENSCLDMCTRSRSPPDGGQPVHRSGDGSLKTLNRVVDMLISLSECTGPVLQVGAEKSDEQLQQRNVGITKLPLYALSECKQKCYADV